MYTYMYICMNIYICRMMKDDMNLSDDIACVCCKKARRIQLHKNLYMFSCICIFMYLLTYLNLCIR